MGTLRMKRGDSFSFTACLLGDIPERTVFSFYLRKSAKDTGAPLIKKNTVSGGVLIDGRELIVSLEPADTLSLTNESRIYSYEITQKDQDGQFFTLDSGDFQIRANLSR